MAKFYGAIGFAELSETSPGVWTESITERKYYGDILSNYRKLENSGYENDNININNRISIVADAYANENYFAMRYIQFMGAKWKINNVEVLRPRLILSIGGLYNGNEI